MVSPKTIPQTFFDTVQNHADTLAIQDEFSGQGWSYEELGVAVSHAGRVMLELGLERGDRVGIWAPNMVEWIIAALGAQSAGGVLVPLNTRFKGQEAGFVLEKGNVRFLFCVGEFLDTNYLDLLYEAYGGRGDENHPIANLESLEKIILFRGENIAESSGIIDWQDFLEMGESTTEKLATRMAEALPEDLSDILFTSGTTGLPKGVLITHSQSLRGYASWSKCVGLHAGDKYLIVNPFFHSFGYKSGWLASFMVGASIFPMAVFDAGQVLKTIEKYRITVLPGPPTIFQSILNHPEFDSWDLSSLRLAVTGAAAIPVDLIRSMRTELKFEDIFTGYGLSESSGIATMCAKGDAPEIIATTSGKAIPNVEVIVAEEQGVEVERGQPGEVLIRGYNVTQGYLDDPEVTTVIDKEGWLHTGDIGIMDEQGYLRITDRKKDMYIMGGFNVYPAEVENIIMSHPDISQVAVVGAPDETYGEIGMAFIIPKATGQKIEEAEFLEWCRKNMANFKVPRKAILVEELPLNASGKVLKYELRQQLS